MQSNEATARVGSLVAGAALMGAAFGMTTYVVQRPDPDLSTVSVTLRTHDEVVFWPNHSSVQRSAVATVNNADGQQHIRDVITQRDQLISVEATAMGDPASVEIRATSDSEAVASEAVVAAGQLAVSEAISQRIVPLEAEIRSISEQIPGVVAERDELLRQAIEADLTTTERAVVSQDAESAAAVASALETDLARLEADVASARAPLVLVNNPEVVGHADSALKSSLATALGVFLMSLLGFSLFRQPKESADAQLPTIDLSEVEAHVATNEPSTELTAANG